MLSEILHAVHFLYIRMSLNPCSNGRCSQSLSGNEVKALLSEVLILVLMEDALRELIMPRKRNGKAVLILVLMEDALRVDN